jgi:hypothetical protein
MQRRGKTRPTSGIIPPSEDLIAVKVRHGGEDQDGKED